MSPDTSPFAPDRQAPMAMAYDHQVRMETLRRLVDALDPSGRRAALDVGGAPGLLADHLAGRPVWTVDLGPCRRERYARADAARLPFADGAFPIVVASDALEHIAPAARDGAVDEMARVAADALILNGPFQTAGAAWMDRQADTWSRRFTGRPHPWLGEHVANGLPALGDVCRRLCDRGAQARLYPNSDGERLFLVRCAEALAEVLPGALSALPALSALMNRRSAEGGALRRFPYRHAVVACWNGPPPDVAPDGEPGLDLNGLGADPDAVLADLYARRFGAVEERLEEVARVCDIVLEAVARRPDACGPSDPAAYIAALEQALADNAPPGGWWRRRLARWKERVAHALGRMP